MYPLSRQIQIATDVAKGTFSRLAGLEPPKYEDAESTFPELLAQLDMTMALLKSFTPEQIYGAEDRTTTFAILRHNGVEIGKKDFLGSID